MQQSYLCEQPNEAPTKVRMVKKRNESVLSARKVLEKIFKAALAGWHQVVALTQPPYETFPLEDLLDSVLYQRILISMLDGEIHVAHSLALDWLGRAHQESKFMTACRELQARGLLVELPRRPPKHEVPFRLDYRAFVAVYLRYLRTKPSAYRPLPAYTEEDARAFEVYLQGAHFRKFMYGELFFPVLAKGLSRPKFQSFREKMWIHHRVGPEWPSHIYPKDELRDRDKHLFQQFFVFEVMISLFNFLRQRWETLQIEKRFPPVSAVASAAPYPGAFKTEKGEFKPEYLDAEKDLEGLCDVFLKLEAAWWDFPKRTPQPNDA